MSPVRPAGRGPAAAVGVAGPARQILAEVVGAVAVVLVGVLGCLAGVVHLAATGRLLHYSALVLAVLAVALCWSVFSVLGARSAPPSGVVVDRASAPGLLGVVAAAASAMQVPAPPVVLLGLGCGVRLVHRDRTLALVVGAPLVWSLRADDLTVLLRAVLASVPEADLPVVRGARTVAARLERAPLPGLVTAPLLRALRSRCRRACAELDIRMGRAAAARIGGAAPSARPQALLDEAVPDVEAAWELVIEEFAAPAWARGWRPARLCAALVDVVEGSERAWRTGGRGPVGSGLVRDAERVDREVSELMADEVWPGRRGRALEWPDYADLVLGPARREQATRLLAAVDLVLGRPGPATPRRILDALGSGAAPAISAVLSARSGGDPFDARGPRALGAALSAWVDCAVESSGVGRVAVAWRTGPVLLSDAGHDPEALRRACADAERGATGALRAALFELGVPLQVPVWSAGDDPPDIGPRPVAALADIWHRGRLCDLVLCADELVLLVATGRGVDVRGAVEHAAGDRARALARLRATLDGDLAAAVARSRHNIRIPLGDIVDVRLRAVLGQLAWRAVVTTADQRLVLRNGRAPGSGRALRDLLAPVLGDRLRVRGIVAGGPEPARGAPTWALGCVGLAAAVAVLAGYLGLAGQVVPAVVEDRLDATTCEVRYLDPRLSEVARAEVDCGPDAERIEVLALPPPLHGQAVTPSAGRALLACLLVVLLAPAAVGTALRVRRSRGRAAGPSLGRAAPTDGEVR